MEASKQKVQANDFPKKGNRMKRCTGKCAACRAKIAERLQTQKKSDQPR